MKKNNQVDIWSLIDNNAVTSLDESIIHHLHFIDGKHIPPNEAVPEFSGLKFLSARDFEDKEKTDAGIKLKVWLSTLDIPEDARDSSCIENWLKQN